MPAKHKTANVNTNGSVPSSVTVTQLAQQIKEHVVGVQARRLNLELIQVANDHTETDLVPGEAPKTGPDGQYLYEDGRPVYPTYGEHFATLDAQLARLFNRADERPGTRALIQKLIAADQATADAEAAGAEADSSEEQIIE